MNKAKVIKKVSCLTCGDQAEIRACRGCTKTAGALVIYPRESCPVCRGRGILIRCKTCDERKLAFIKAEAQRRLDQQALARNPFLPYYSKHFRKYQS